MSQRLLPPTPEGLFCFPWSLSFRQRVTSLQVIRRAIVYSLRSKLKSYFAPINAEFRLDLAPAHWFLYSVAGVGRGAAVLRLSVMTGTREISA